MGTPLHHSLYDAARMTFEVAVRNSQGQNAAFYVYNL